MVSTAYQQFWTRSCIPLPVPPYQYEQLKQFKLTKLTGGRTGCQTDINYIPLHTLYAWVITTFSERTNSLVQNQTWWMVHFNSISVISGQWEGETKCLLWNSVYSWKDFHSKVGIKCWAQFLTAGHFLTHWATRAPVKIKDQNMEMAKSLEYIRIYMVGLENIMKLPYSKMMWLNRCSVCIQID